MEELNVEVQEAKNVENVVLANFRISKLKGSNEIFYAQRKTTEDVLWHSASINNVICHFHTIYEAELMLRRLGKPVDEVPDMVEVEIEDLDKEVPVIL